MNIFLYAIIFIMGVLFGSFYTLAVYRIPKKIDIIHTHSFCPNCGHKLGFFELIPVLSYIFLGGKCKECKQKIRPRYLIFEILSGVVFVLIAYGLKLDVYNLQINIIIRFIFIVLYLVAIFLISGIDREYREINKGVLYYGFVISSIYIIYLCIMNETSIYRYVMYLITLIILLIIDSIKQKNKADKNYFLEIFMLIVLMAINTGEKATLLSILVVGASVIFTKVIYVIKNALNKSKKEHKNMLEIHKFGYLLGLSNTMIFIGMLYFV